MKIIGEAGLDLICVMSRDEAERLVGYYYQRGACNPALRVGTTVDIMAMDRLAERAAAIRDDLRSATKTLRACADLVDGQADLVKQVDP